MKLTADEIAHHHPVICLAPMLFRPLNKNEQSTSLDISYKYNNQITVEYTSPEQLTPFDMRVLQGVVALSCNALYCKPDSNLLDKDLINKLRSNLKISGEWINRAIAIFKTSACQIAKKIGAAINHPSRVMDSLKKLSNLRMSFLSDSQQKSGSSLLLSINTESRQRGCFIALNPELTDCVFLEIGQYVKLDMKLVRQLKSDNARLLYQRLCAFINPGQMKAIYLDALISYLWLPTLNNNALHRRRRKTVLDALKEIVAIDWEIHETTQGLLTIQRPQPSPIPHGGSLA